MKKIKSLFFKLKAKTTLSTYQRPLLVTILKLLLINVIILTVSAIIALRLDTDGKYFDNSFLEAFIASFKWMISVHSINNYDVQEDLKIMILAVIVIATGMILTAFVLSITWNSPENRHIYNLSFTGGISHFISLESALQGN